MNSLLCPLGGPSDGFLPPQVLQFLGQKVTLQGDTDSTESLGHVFQEPCVVGYGARYPWTVRISA